jgi:hypothetical protein
MRPGGKVEAETTLNLLNQDEQEVSLTITMTVFKGDFEDGHRYTSRRWYWDAEVTGMVAALSDGSLYIPTSDDMREWKTDIENAIVQEVAAKTRGAA